MEVTGVATKVQNSKTKTGKDNYYLWIGETKFSGFGKAPCNEGDTITFEYEVNGVYNNIKDISDVKLTGKPNQGTMGEAIGESAKFKRRTELMRCAVDLCLARNTLANEEIMAQFKWFCEQVGENYEDILQSK